MSKGIYVLYVILKLGAKEIVAVKRLRAQSEDFMADSFRGNRALTVLYPTPDWLLSLGIGVAGNYRCPRVVTHVGG